MSKSIDNFSLGLEGFLRRELIDEAERSDEDMRVINILKRGKMNIEDFTAGVQEFTFAHIKKNKRNVIQFTVHFDGIKSDKKITVKARRLAKEILGKKSHERALLEGLKDRFFTKNEGVLDSIISAYSSSVNERDIIGKTISLIRKKLNHIYESSEIIKESPDDDAPIYISGFDIKNGLLGYSTVLQIFFKAGDNYYPLSIKLHKEEFSRAYRKAPKVKDLRKALINFDTYLQPTRKPRPVVAAAVQKAKMPSPLHKEDVVEQKALPPQEDVIEEKALHLHREDVIEAKAALSPHTTVAEPKAPPPPQEDVIAPMAPPPPPPALSEEVLAELQEEIAAPAEGSAEYYLERYKEAYPGTIEPGKTYVLANKDGSKYTNFYRGERAGYNIQRLNFEDLSSEDTIIILPNGKAHFIKEIHKGNVTDTLRGLKEGE